MADVPVLYCTEGSLKGQRIAVPDGGLDIGRSDDNHVVIGDDGVSRFHARLLFDNGSLWLQDAGSRNGVFVNGVRVTGHQALKMADTISIAQHAFVVRWDDESSLVRTPMAASDRMTPLPRRDEDTTADEPPEPARKRWFWPFS